jgi:hypothetical protein
MAMADVRAAGAHLRALGAHGRAANPCIGPDRADLVAPGAAIRRLAKSLYVPIGDTFMKVDFRGASPGTVNGMVLCVGMALATADAFPSSRWRTTRKSSARLRTRRTQSAPF